MNLKELADEIRCNRYRYEGPARRFDALDDRGVVRASLDTCRLCKECLIPDATIDRACAESSDAREFRRLVDEIERRRAVKPGHDCTYFHPKQRGVRGTQ